MNYLRAVLMSLLLLLLPFSVCAGIIEGRLAYRNGNYQTAKLEFEAERGSGAIGSYFLALMYLRGEGVPKNDDRGQELLKASADDGYAAAQYLLGKRYLYGLGVPKNIATATACLLAAAADDDYRAVVLLKIIDKGSRGERKDQEQVVATVKRKARAGDPDAQNSLAFMHLVGDGVPKEAGQELRWYRAAAARNPRAAFMLSLMYYYGDGISRNAAEAVKLMKSAADQGEVRAQFYLGTFYYHGVGSRVDRPFAAAWFRKSAEGGFPEAQLAYGMVLLSGDGVAQDKAQAIEWLGRAARQNNSRAKEVIGELLSYRGQPLKSPLTGEVPAEPRSGETTADRPLRLEGKGVILDQGLYGLKFSLPTLYDAYAPQSQVKSPTVWDHLQGGTFEIIFRQPK